MMKTKTLFTLSVSLGLFAWCSLSHGAENNKEAVREIKGKWVATDVNYFGKTPPKDIIEKVTVSVGDSAIEIASIAYGNGKFSISEKPFKAPYLLNATTNPKEIDLMLSAGGQKIRMLGIYSTANEQFKLCIQVEGSARPQEFLGSESPPVMLFVLKRDKQ